MSSRLFYLLVYCILIFAFSLFLFGSNTTLAYSLWLEHTIDTDFQGAEHIYAADVDKDGDMDILGAASVADDIAWYENDGSQIFTKHVIDGTFDGANCVYAADVDGDTDMDVLASAEVADDIVWYQNTDGNGSFSTAIVIDGALDGANYVYAADVDGDTDMDVLASAEVADTIAWWENTDGNGTFSTAIVIDNTFDGVNCVYAANVDGVNGIDVIASADGATNDYIVWYENNGIDNPTFTEYIIDNTFAGANYVYAADVNGDGNMDVLGSAGVADDIAWYENDGTEIFTKHLVDQEFDGASSVHADDVDGDGDIDILGTALYAGYVGWYENNGIENFTKHAIDDDFWAAGGASTGAKHVYTADIEIVVGDEYIDVVACAFGPANGQITWYSYPLGPTEGCFIATAAYGTPMAEEIQVLRDFRDQYLVTNPVGEVLVKLYYKTSPPIADFIADHPALKHAVRAGLEPVIAMSTVAVNITLAQKIAIVSSIVLLSTLMVVWFRRKARRGVRPSKP